MILQIYKKQPASSTYNSISCTVHIHEYYTPYCSSLPTAPPYQLAWRDRLRYSNSSQCPPLSYLLHPTAYPPASYQGKLTHSHVVCFDHFQIWLRFHMYSSIISPKSFLPITLEPKSSAHFRLFTLTSSVSFHYNDFICEHKYWRWSFAASIFTIFSPSCICRLMEVLDEVYIRDLNFCTM